MKESLVDLCTGQKSANVHVSLLHKPSSHINQWTVSDKNTIMFDIDDSIPFSFSCYFVMFGKHLMCLACKPIVDLIWKGCQIT